MECYHPFWSLSSSHSTHGTLNVAKLEIKAQIQCHAIVQSATKRWSLWWPRVVMMVWQCFNDVFLYNYFVDEWYAVTAHASLPSLDYVSSVVESSNESSAIMSATPSYIDAPSQVMPTIHPDKILQCLNCRGRYRARNYVVVEGVDTVQRNDGRS